MYESIGMSFSENYLSLENEKEFLIEFLFELTIAYRALRGGSPNELRQINEINHRVLNRLRDLESGEKWSTRKDTLDVIYTHLKNAPGIAPEVSVASKKAFERTINK